MLWQIPDFLIDDDTSKRKIKVSIKPVSNTDVISARVDELHSAIGRYQYCSLVEKNEIFENY